MHTKEATKIAIQLRSDVSARLALTKRGGFTAAMHQHFSGESAFLKRNAAKKKRWSKNWLSVSGLPLLARNKTITAVNGKKMLIPLSRPESRYKQSRSGSAILFSWHFAAL